MRLERADFRPEKANSRSRRTDLRPQQFFSTDTFFMVWGGPVHVQSMAKKSNIFLGVPFFKIPFFWGLLEQVIKFSLFLNSSLVLLVTFERIELEMPD